MSTAFLAAVSSLIMAFSGILTQLAQTNLVPSRGCTAPAQVLVFDVRPQDIALGATAEVALRFTRAKAWHISSRLGNTLSRVQGSVPGSGDAVTTYRADSVGRDTLTLTVTPQDPACEVDVRTGTVVVSGGE